MTQPSMSPGRQEGAESGQAPKARKGRGWLYSLRRGGRFGFTSLVFLALVCAAAVIAPVISPHNPNEQDMDSILTPPGARHLLGTDYLGRDLLSRVIYGSRVSLVAGVLAVGIALVLGSAMGLAGGYWGGTVDMVLSRLVDALQSFPMMVLAIAIAAVLGPSLQNAVIAVGVVYSPIFARLLRGQVLSLREKEFVEAARAVGVHDVRIILKYIVPNLSGPLIVQTSISIASAILTEAGLSFLGLGVQPPTPSWGSMLREGYPYLEQAPWWAISSGAAIFMTVLAFNFLGDAIRDMADPRSAWLIRRPR